MKKIILLLNSIFYSILLLTNTPLYSQSFRPFLYEELARPLREMTIVHNEAMAAINELYGYVTVALSHDIDNQLRKELTEELKKLDELAKLLSQNGYSVTIANGYNNIYISVQREIAAYNNRVANERDRYRNEDRKNIMPETWSGTGFAIMDGYLATNYHVIEGASSILVFGINGDINKSYSGTVLTKDSVSDLAIIKVNDLSSSGLGPISYGFKTTPSDVGEDVFVLGYPLTATMGEEIKYTTGVISSTTGYQGDASLYQISAPIQPGNSGGPLFNSNGDVIGIVSAKHAGAENASYAIKTSYLISLLKTCFSNTQLSSKTHLSSLPRPEQIKEIKKSVYLIKCSSSGNTNQIPNSSQSLVSASPISLTAPVVITTTLKINESISLSTNGKQVSSWESNNPSVVSVSSAGLVTGISPGSTIVYATFQDGEKEAYFITVRNAMGSFVDSSAPVSTTIKIGDNIQLSVNGTSSRVSSWLSDNPQVVNVSSYGTITGMTVGDTTVWAELSDGNRVPFLIKSRLTYPYIPSNSDHLGISDTIQQDLDDSISFSSKKEMEINGTVRSKSNNAPIAGVMISVEGEIKTKTDMEGRFSIHCKLGEKLSFSCDNYQHVTLYAISSKLDVLLESNE